MHYLFKRKLKFIQKKKCHGWYWSLKSYYVLIQVLQKEVLMKCASFPKILVSWKIRNKLILLTFLVAASAELLQSCLTLCDPIDGSPPGSPVPGILQAGTLEGVAISVSNLPSQRNWNSASVVFMFVDYCYYSDQDKLSGLNIAIF